MARNWGSFFLRALMRAMFCKEHIVWWSFSKFMLNWMRCHSMQRLVLGFWIRKVKIQSYLWNRNCYCFILDWWHLHSYSSKDVVISPWLSHPHEGLIISTLNSHHHLSPLLLLLLLVHMDGLKQVSVIKVLQSFHLIF